MRKIRFRAFYVDPPDIRKTEILPYILNHIIKAVINKLFLANYSFQGSSLIQEIQTILERFAHTRV